MKCNICNSKKAKRFCMATKTEICSICCGTNRNLRRCNSNCSFFPNEQTNRIIVGNPELTQVDNGKVVLFASNCFLPNIFDLLTMYIKSFEIYVLDYGTIRIKLNFILKENIEKTNRNIDVNEVYLKDEWKKIDNGIDDNVVPLIQIYTKKGGKSNFNGNQYQIGNKKVNITKISNYLNTFMPYSKNDLEKIEPKEAGLPRYINANVCKGQHFQGKNDTYFCELKLNEDYYFDFKIEYEELTVTDNLIAYPFGLFFPFELINIHSFKIYTTDEINFSQNSLVHLLLPNNENIQNYNLIPLEGNENCFCAKACVSFGLDTMNPPFHYDKYAIKLFDLGLESKNELMCKSIYTDLPLQLGNYESLNSIYDNMYAPIKLSIVNNTNNIKKIEIFTKIENLSDELKQTIQLLPREYKLISLCPNLNINERNNILDITKRNIKLVVKSNNEIIMEETHELIIFPKNLFVFSMENPEKNWKVSLTPHLARFVMPHNKCINEIYTLASRKMPLRGYLSNNREILLKEIQSIYDVLSENYQLEYVVDSYWFGTDDYKKQNIKLPNEVISTKCGNCIEFSLLLASCYEMLNLDVFIILIPGHAFLGVKLFGNEKIYIESTMIGKKDFITAVTKGQEEYDYNFEDNNAKVSDAQIIAIKDSRKIGIYPIE